MSRTEAVSCPLPPETELGSKWGSAETKVNNREQAMCQLTLLLDIPKLNQIFESTAYTSVICKNLVYDEDG
jgi:hypothetical protein